MTMLRLFTFTTVFVLLLKPSTSLTISVNDDPTNEALHWADVTATRLVNCYYNNSNGLWPDELEWQSGNTLESLANFVSLPDPTLTYVFNLTFTKTDQFAGGDCFDDYQWFLLAWMQIYKVDSNIKYLQRAADIHNAVATKAWNATLCSGGIQWCPKTPYKNAITNELFLSSSMRLHPYATLLGKPSTYYLDWALKEWQWFEQSGMINSDYLINDGLSSAGKYSRRDQNSLDDNTCLNNNQTTWTYNQGVVLSGLALLYNATQNATLLNVAQNIADATIQHLTYSSGILKEPCEPNCDNDQKLFKGIFARHLGYLLPYLTDAVHIEKYTSFLQQNAASLWMNDRCETDGLFGLFWNNYSSNSCDSSRSIATTSSALDIFTVASRSRQPASTAKWMLLGLGNCMDNNNAYMPNYYSNQVNETICRATAYVDTSALAYDYRLDCNGNGFCRIRTLSGSQKTPPGFEYQDGNARYVSRTNEMTLTNCYLKIH